MFIMGVHEEDMLFTKTEERHSKNHTECKKKTKVFYINLENGIWTHSVELICNLHLISILI